MSGDMLNVIRFALQAVRHEYTLENYQINQSPPTEMKVKTRQAFEWATIDAAKMLGIDDKLGTIESNKIADIIAGG